MSYRIIRLTDKPDILETAARWFHEKWGIPLEAYRESMEECLAGRSPAPQWYMAVADRWIVGGLGVIENDFHDRKDLTPNVCAVYVEEAYRRQGIAGELLRHACADMAGMGVGVLYLLTDHTSYYNRFTVQGTAASRVFFRIVAKAVRMGGHWPDFRLQGLARPKESPSASLSFAAFDLCR